jgi:hypothetical protein
MIEYVAFAKNGNIRIVANASIQTRSFLQSLSGEGLSARLLPD